MLDVLPGNHSKINIGQKRLLSFCAKYYLSGCGNNINIQKRTNFSSRCVIGDNSGIGRYSTLYGPVTIGNNVMMGPYCTIYTQNHAYGDLSRPMNTQGFTPDKQYILVTMYGLVDTVSYYPEFKLDKVQ